MRWRGLWRRVQRALGLAPPPEPPPSPPEEPSLVPLVPRRPLGASGVALELPEEPRDTDARGHDVG